MPSQVRILLPPLLRSLKIFVFAERGCRGRSSMVELQPSKLVVWVRFPSPALSGLLEGAAVAQLVEYVLGKDEVMGSSPISSSGWLWREVVPRVRALCVSF